MDRVRSVPLQGNLKTNLHCKLGYNSLACFGDIYTPKYLRKLR